MPNYVHIVVTANKLTINNNNNLIYFQGSPERHIDPVLEYCSERWTLAKHFCTRSAQLQVPRHLSNDTSLDFLRSSICARTRPITISQIHTLVILLFQWISAILVLLTWLLGWSKSHYYLNNYSEKIQWKCI